MEYIKGILTAIQLLKELVDGVKSLAAYMEASRTEAWFQESAAVFSRMREAKTEDERRQVISDLGRVWSKL